MPFVDVDDACRHATYVYLRYRSVGFGGQAWRSSGLLLYEHSIVSEKDLGRVNTAFFHMNVLVGLGWRYSAAWMLSFLR